MPRIGRKLSKAGKKQGTILPYRFEGEHGPSETLILDFQPQNCETINFWYFMPPGSWCFVTAALGNSHSEQSHSCLTQLRLLCNSPDKHRNKYSNVELRWCESNTHQITGQSLSRRRMFITHQLCDLNFQLFLWSWWAVCLRTHR